MTSERFDGTLTLDRDAEDQSPPRWRAVLATRDQLDHAKRRVNPEAYGHQRGAAIPLVVGRHEHDRDGVTVPIGVGAGKMMFVDREGVEVEDPRVAYQAVVEGSLYDTSGAREFLSIYDSHRALGVGGASVGSNVLVRDVKRGMSMDRAARAMGAAADVIRADAREVAYVWQPSLKGDTFELDRDGGEPTGEYERELKRLGEIQPFSD